MITSDEYSFDELPEAERTLLWAMRVWVIGHCRQQDVSARIDATLATHGVDGGLGYLEGFMAALSRGTWRPIEVLCLCRTEVSADERVLLGAFSLLQQDEADEAQSLLCSFLTEQAATVAIRSAESLAHEFLDAGLSLPFGAGAFGLREDAAMHRVLH